MIYKIDAGNVAVGSEVNGADYIQAVALKVNNFPTTTGSNYAYVLNASETTDGEDYRYFELWTSNGLLEAYEETSDLYTYDGGEIVTYEVVSTADGRTIIKDIALAGNVQLGAITSGGFYGTNDNSISIDGDKYDLTNDATVLNVDTDAKEGYNSEDPKSGAREARANTYNILYVVNPGDASEIEFVLIDGKNNKILNLGNGTASANASDINAKLQSYEQVTVSDKITSGTITVPAEKELVLAQMPAQNVVLKVDAAATVKFENNFVFGQDGTAYANGEVVLTANANGGWTIEAAAGTQLTLTSSMSIGSETNNVYTGSASAATQATSPLAAGTYTWTNNMTLTSGGTASGWLAN